MAAAIPRPALWLGLAGLLPFLWAAACLVSPSLRGLSLALFGPRLGTTLMLGYGVIILSFMSGVLWGFAARATTQPWLYYGLSVIPALWALFMVGGPMPSGYLALAAGYLGLLGLDWLFAAHGLAPAWWMRLRIMLTAVVVLCLALAAATAPTDLPA
jgi:hypothetical protein